MRTFSSLRLRRNAGTAERASKRRSLIADESGATAVEFGLVAAPFFALMFAILQIGLIFFSGQVLDNATSEAARMIRTGQAQMQGFGQQDFKDVICARSGTLFDCQDKLKVDVRTYDTFAAANMGKPVEDGALDDGDFTFQMGGREEIVVVRVFYEWPVWVPLMATPGGEKVQLGDLATGNYMLSSALTFRNDPF